MKFLKIFFLSFLLFGLVSFAYSAQCTDSIPATAGDLNSYITDCQNKINSLKNEQQTLKAAIQTLDSKIRLTIAQITLTSKEIVQLEKDIETLSIVVSDLNIQLDKLSSIYVSRVVESYKRRDPNPLVLFATSDTISNYLSKKKYLSIIKARDRLILGEMTSAKQNYDAQKEAKIVKQKQIKELKDKLLAQQKDLLSLQKGKKDLLVATANSEVKYQKLLEDAKAELQAIQDAIAGKGTETEVGKKNAGDKIATIIQGPSVCSTGSHVHLETYKNDSRQNPATFLKSTEVIWQDTQFSFTGNLDWPVNPTIYLTQGYGLTNYALHGGKKENNYCAYGTNQSGGCLPHTGIDISSTDSTVKTIMTGTLYRGSLQVDYGCVTTGLLRYVKVVHDTGLVSYYFHVNYF